MTAPIARSAGSITESDHGEWVEVTLPLPTPEALHIGDYRGARADFAVLTQIAEQPEGIITANGAHLHNRAGRLTVAGHLEGHRHRGDALTTELVLGGVTVPGLDHSHSVVRIEGRA